MASRFLNPTTPGGLLSPSNGDELTPTEELTVQAIASGSYFVEGEVPTGTINGSNAVFTLANAPSPATSLEVWLNGIRLKVTEDYTLASATLTLLVAPDVGSLLLVNYRRQP